MARRQRCFLLMTIRLPLVADDEIQPDFFDNARRWAAALLVVGGAAAIAGSALDWVVITARPQLQRGVDFGQGQPGVVAPEITRPFTGLEAGDGWFVAIAGLVLVGASLLLLLRKRALYAYLALLASIVIGAIAFADYRGVGDLSSSIAQRMDIVGKARPALGLTLVAVSAFAGLFGSVAGIAASPRR